MGRRVKAHNASVFNQAQSYVINNFGSTVSLTSMLADLSFYFAQNTDNRINYGPVMENIVY